MLRNISTACALAAALTLVPLPAGAEETGKNPFFGLSLGVKGGGGGNYVTKPDSVPANYESAPFADGGGGWGAGGGLYTELRVLGGYLGLEIDLLFDHTKDWCNIEYNNVVKMNYIYSFTAVRIPFLIKGSLESGMTRFSLGIGPEISAGFGVSRDVEITEGSQYVTSLDPILSAYSASAQTDVLLDVDLGVAFRIAPIAITADIRYAYNLTQPSKFEDRFFITRSLIEPMASSTMDLRILVGVAYELGFDM
ncbi:MAG: hypothetical protein PHU25_07255 [Deltaproteobacteria bacterium]|nr:hypothetical protein [Deltaproteobacteria bacterium]